MTEPRPDLLPQLIAEAQARHERSERMEKALVKIGAMLGSWDKRERGLAEQIMLRRLAMIESCVKTGLAAAEAEEPTTTEISAIGAQVKTIREAFKTWPEWRKAKIAAAAEAHKT